MLRPATILSVFIFVAFGLMLIATISAPIINAIPLGNVDDVKFGVFGFCSADKCSEFQIGYDPSEFLKTSESKFDLPTQVRDALTTILIVHPVAAFLTLVLFIMAAAAHFRSPGNSVRYLLILFLFSVVTFLVCLLSFIVDILLFVPHLGWASYLVIAATVMIALSGLFICAMRRTLISRKDRTHRVAQNAEMSGENYYNREAQRVPGSRQPTMPTVTGANGPGDALPTFASFEDDKPHEERIPLTQRSPSERSAHLARAGTGSPVNALGEPVRSNSVPLGSDQYGNPMGPSPGDYAALRQGQSNDALNASSGYRGIRGSYGGGAYGSPARGGYGSRGGYGVARGGPGSMRGGGGVYQNYGGSYDRHPSPVNAYGAYSQGSTDSYATANASASYGAYSSDYPRAESPPTIASSQPGQAIEMSGTTTAITTPGSTAQYIRDSDTDVAGMVGLQQGLGGGRQPTESYLSDGSKYSNEDAHGQYVPPRAGWNQTGRHSPSVPSPLAIGRSTPASDRTSPESRGPAYYEDDSRYAGDASGRARSPQWGGFPGGRPTPQNSNPNLRGQGGLSPPPAQGRAYNAF